jgi:uncharacterized protein (TIGR03086 family)
MDTIATMGQVVAETTKIVDGIEPDQLGNATPCTEWTVRDLLNHITGGATMFAIAAEEGSVPDDVFGRLVGGDNLGDDYRGAWKKASQRAVAAFGIPGAMDRVVKLPFGEMPAGVALSIAVFDVTTHATDLSKATDQPAPPVELLETALAVGHQMIGPDLRVPGVFDAEQPAPADAAPSDRLLAFAGRRV